MSDPETLTRPEKSAAFGHARRFAQAELANGNACSLCTHRSTETYWDRHRCALSPSRSFPLCIKDRQAPAFELDESTLKGKIHG